MPKVMKNIKTINTSYSKRKAVEILKREKFDCLFLNFSRSQEEFIREMAMGSNPETVIEKMRELGLVKDPEDTQEYRAAIPLFEFISSLDESKIYCYKGEASLSLSRDYAVRTLILTLRAKIGKIDVEEWKDVMRDTIYSEMSSADEEAEYIAGIAGRKNVCIDGSKRLMSRLSELGFRVEEVVVDSPCRPLDILREKVERELLYNEPLEDGEVIRLVKEHVRFVDMVIKSGYEEACKAWQRMSLWI